MKKKIKNRSIEFGPKGAFRVVKDFLPSVDELIRANRTERITLNLSSDTLEFLRNKAKKADYPYQQLIRNMLDKLVELETRK